MRRFYIAVSLTTICMLGLSAAGQADAWGTSLWTDDFEDGNYTANPAWAVAGDPFMAASRQVVSWEGDYAFQVSAPYVDAIAAGWSLAYVPNAIGDQRMLVWVDTSALPSDDAATVCLLRYTPTASVGFGTGYAVVIIHGTAGAIAVQLYQIREDGYDAITDPVLVSATYTDVWVRAVAMGTDSSIRVLARVWPAGQPEGSSWTLDSTVQGSGGAPISNYYNTGSGGVGTVALATGITATTYFDDLDFVQVTLCAEPPW